MGKYSRFILINKVFVHKKIYISKQNFPLEQRKTFQLSTRNKNDKNSGIRSRAQDAMCKCVFIISAKCCNKGSYFLKGMRNVDYGKVIVCARKCEPGWGENGASGA